jgi:3-methyladenine DNA glycosylase AlkD
VFVGTTRPLARAIALATGTPAPLPLIASPVTRGRSELMTIGEILQALRRSGEPERVAALRRSGVASPAVGASLPALRALARRIGRDHDLALALWGTPLREARILASLIDEPARVTDAQMDLWAEAFDSWEICDQCCQNLFWRVPFALAKAGGM